MNRSVLTFVAIANLIASPALACSFHGYAPQATLVERLLGSDHIALARATEQEPFRYADIEVLEGDKEFVEIPHLVDSSTRRKLTANPDDHVLFARDGAYGPWERIAYVDDALEPVIRVVMERLPAWQVGDDFERFSYFASLLNETDVDVYSLALQELDLADYGTLRSLDLNVDTQRQISRLNLRYEADLKPIRLLLLGLSKDSIAPEFFENGVRAHSNSSGGLLGAYATAMLEHGGSAAVIRLVENHLKNTALPSISREMLTEALAIHSSTGDEATRATIQDAIGTAIKDHPEIAPMVARHFGARYDWSQSAAISELMRSGVVKSPLEMLLLTQYVSLADEFSEPVQN